MVQINFPDAELHVAYMDIISGSETNWMIGGYQQTDTDVHLYARGSAGVTELRQHLTSLEDPLLYAFVRLTEGSCILLTVLKDDANAVVRARALLHGGPLADMFKNHQGHVTVTDLADLTEETLLAHLSESDSEEIMEEVEIVEDAPMDVVVEQVREPEPPMRSRGKRSKRITMFLPPQPEDIEEEPVESETVAMEKEALPTPPPTDEDVSVEQDTLHEQSSAEEDVEEEDVEEDDDLYDLDAYAGPGDAAEEKDVTGVAAPLTPPPEKDSVKETEILQELAPAVVAKPRRTRVVSPPQPTEGLLGNVTLWNHETRLWQRYAYTIENRTLCLFRTHGTTMTLLRKVEIDQVQKMAPAKAEICTLNSVRIDFAASCKEYKERNGESLYFYADSHEETTRLMNHILDACLV